MLHNRNEIVCFQHQIENDAPSSIKVSFDGPNLDEMEFFSKCALGTYYYTANFFTGDGPAIYIQSKEDYEGCGYSGRSVIFLDRDDRQWIGAVIFFLYCILLMISLISLKCLYISIEIIFS